MALIAQSDLEARIGRALTAEEASSFTVINAALQAYVEKLIGSSVEAANASSRYYDGGVQHLSVDPCTDISRIDLVDDDYNAVYEYDTSDYTTDPVNQTLKTMLRHRSGCWVTGINNIKVTAKFSTYGDTSTTNIIKDALLDALASEIQNSNNIQKESIEGYSVEYASTEAKSALNKIRYLFPGI